jgi:hypothetical protein
VFRFRYLDDAISPLIDLPAGCLTAGAVRVQAQIVLGAGQMAIGSPAHQLEHHAASPDKQLPWLVGCPEHSVHPMPAAVCLPSIQPPSRFGLGWPAGMMKMQQSGRQSLRFLSSPAEDANPRLVSFPQRPRQA